jgi:hypothetical protein
VDHDLAARRAELDEPPARFQDTTPAIAILDRLLHHATVVSINGDSYRMRAHRDAIAALRPTITGGEKP